MKLKKELRVAISGKSGCGNTTVSTLLSQKLGIKMINYTFRQLAAEKGLTLAQVIENAKNDDSYDKYVDTHQVELAEKACEKRMKAKVAEVKKELSSSADTAESFSAVCSVLSSVPAAS